MRSALALASLLSCALGWVPAASAAPREDGEAKPADPAEGPPRGGGKAPHEGEAEGERRRSWDVDPMADDPAGVAKRRFMVGIEGVVMQTPPLRSDVVTLDPRFVGRSVAMGGLGVFGRFRPRPLVGFDLSVRSGSVRYRDREVDDVHSHDLIGADLGVLLYLGRGKVAQFAVSGGLGGMYNRVKYDLDEGPSGTQQWGAGLVRVGAEAEFLVKRVAFVLSFRSYGVFTDRDRVSNSGALLEGGFEEAAPVAALQTYLVGSAGIAFRL